MQPLDNPPQYTPGVYVHQPHPHVHQPHPHVHQPHPHVHQPYGPQVIHTSVVQGGTVPIIRSQHMGLNSSTFTCKSCNAEILTRIVMRPTLRTHMFACLLCFVGCWPCFCVPYCMESCNNIEHYCPNCGAYIGTYIN